MNKAITIFGGSGDLSFRKLLPALYNLHYLHKLTDDFKIFVVGRRDYNNQVLHDLMLPSLEKFSRFSLSEFNSFCERVIYVKINLDQSEDYLSLIDYYQKYQISDHIFYYAVAPHYFEIITKNLPNTLNFSRIDVVVEKPFGHDKENASYLHQVIANRFTEKHSYYIDHYLGKEMIQNILSLRFNNIVFEGIWNHNFIESIHINALESEGIGTRAGYFDQQGTIKDMIQNHLLQILSLVCMEKVDTNDYQAIQNSQLKVLEELKFSDDIILGQYDTYHQEKNIPSDSNTETLVSVKVEVDNPRFKGVNIYLNSGKKFTERETEVIIKFKSTSNHALNNLLIIKVQPEEGVYFRFNTKKAGSKTDLQPVSMDFCHSCILENRLNTPESYERLIFDVINGDKSLFSSWQFIKKSWELTEDLKTNYLKYHQLLKYHIATKDLLLPRKKEG